MKILIADDDEDDRMVFVDALSEVKMKTQVSEVTDGLELLEHLEGLDSYPDLIFLDINMPRMNGIQCLEEIKKRPEYKSISVAIYSTSGAERDIEETFVRGANVYIRKPGDFASLEKVLEEVLSINWQFHTSGLNKETFLLNV